MSTKSSTVEDRVNAFLENWLATHPGTTGMLGSDTPDHTIVGAYAIGPADLTVEDVAHLLESHLVLQAIVERVNDWKYNGDRWDIDDAVSALDRVDELGWKRGGVL